MKKDDADPKIASSKTTMDAMILWIPLVLDDMLTLEVRTSTDLFGIPLIDSGTNRKHQESD